MDVARTARVLSSPLIRGDGGSRRHAFADRRLARDLHDGSRRGDGRGFTSRQQPEHHPDESLLQLNVRTFDVRETVLSAIERIINAEATASQAPKPPSFAVVGEFPLTSNDEAATGKVAEALTGRSAATFSKAIPQRRVRTSASLPGPGKRLPSSGSSAAPIRRSMPRSNRLVV